VAYGGELGDRRREGDDLPSLLGAELHQWLELLPLVLGCLLDQFQ